MEIELGAQSRRNGDPGASRSEVKKGRGSELEEEKKSGKNSVCSHFFLFHLSKKTPFFDFPEAKWLLPAIKSPISGIRRRLLTRACR